MMTAGESWLSAKVAKLLDNLYYLQQLMTQVMEGKLLKHCNLWNINIVFQDKNSRPNVTLCFTERHCDVYFLYAAFICGLTLWVGHSDAQYSGLFYLTRLRASKPWQHTSSTTTKKLHEPGTQFANFMVHLQLSLFTSGNGSTMVRCNIFIISFRYGAKCFPHTPFFIMERSTCSFARP